MAETLPHLDTGPTPDREATAGTSRWQKVVGVIGLVVVLWVGGDLFDVATRGDERPGAGAGPGTPPDGAPPGEPHDPSGFDH